jgi:DNA-binding PadR family transcriptional regulator
MSGTDLLGEFEQLVLLGVLRNGAEAYALPVRHTLESVTERSISRGALYRTLDRLEVKGLVGWTLEAPTEERGGHPRKRYRVTDLGVSALQRSREVMSRATVGLEGLLTEGR